MTGLILILGQCDLYFMVRLSKLISPEYTILRICIIFWLMLRADTIRDLTTI